MKILPFSLSLIILTSSVWAGSNAFSARHVHKAVTEQTSLHGHLPTPLPFDEAPTLRGCYLSSLSQSQQTAFQALAEQSTKLVVHYDASTQSATFIQGASLSPGFQIASPEDVASACSQFLGTAGPLLGLQNAASELVVSSVIRDAQGMTHVRLQQRCDGITVWGTEAILHFNADGKVCSYNGRLWNSSTHQAQSFSSTPVVDQDAAKGLCLQDLQAAQPVESLSTTMQSLLDYRQPLVEKVVLPSRSSLTAPATLCWHYTIRPNAIHRWEYFVDCSTGAIVFKYDNTCSDGPATANATDLKGNTVSIHSYLSKGSYYLIDATRTMFNAGASQFPNATVGTIWTIDARNTDLSDFYNVSSSNNTWSDKSSVSAHTNSATTYEYYRNTHNRNSIDGQGGTIISVIHVTQGGSGMDNAYWNGKLMAYGDGKSLFNPLASAIDVAAHEMTHGVTEHTCALEYLSQSGAINESMSDVFGCFVERKNWKIGEDVVRTAFFPTGCLRDMANPHNGGSSINDNGWQPATMSEYVSLPETQDGDNGGVHVNSGIPNHAAYLIQAAIGMDKAEKIYYAAETKYLTKNSQFIDLRRAIIQAAQALYGSTEMTACASAFDAVQIFDGNPTNTNHDQQAVVGTEWILLHNTNFNVDPNSLYIVKPTNPQSSDFHPISFTPLSHRPSVVDNGTFAVFVARDNTLHAINMDYNNPSETILNSSPVWDNVAISRDGMRMAAISTEIDSSIYVFDFASTPITQQRYVLYAPTTAQGIRNYNIPYADAMEWDYSGRFVLFDALNRIDNGQGDTVEYWNISTLRAFEPSSSNFGDGAIFSILPSLPSGISVGNPTYSKNSPNIIAYDEIDDNAGVYRVMAINTETGADATLVDNNPSLGYPSYGRLDDKVAYQSLDNQGRSIVNILPVSADHISASGSGVFLASDAEFPVFFTIGTRPAAVTDLLDTEPRISPNPATDHLDIYLQEELGAGATVRVFDVVGLERQRQAVDTSDGIVVLSTSGLENGVYTVAIENAGRTVHARFVVSR